jgi:hypothetical protein
MPFPLRFSRAGRRVAAKDELDHLSKMLIVLKARIIRLTAVDEMLPEEKPQVPALSASGTH